MGARDVPVRISVWFYRSLLRILPAWFGKRFASEATQVFADVAKASYSSNGLLGLTVLWGKTLSDLATGAWQERATYVSLASLGPTLRGAQRGLRREPWFSAAVILTIGLGVGSATAIYTLAHGILLRPLPFPGSERVLALCEAAPETLGYCIASPPNVRDLGAMTAAVDHAGVARTWRFRRQDGADSSPMTVGIATPGFLRAHEPSLLHGRMFTESELTPGDNQIVVLMHSFWQQWASGDPDVVGQRVTLDGKEFSVIGVFGPNTWFPQFEHAAAWAPITATPDDPDQRDWRGFVSVARILEGVSLEQASAELEASYASLTAEYPEDLAGWDLQVERLRTQMTGDAVPAIRLFGLAVACLLLIGCANVANLLIVRAQARAPETAVRAALGAGRTRLAAQSLAESLMLAATGGVVGIGLAVVLVRAGITYAPPGIPRLDEVGIDLNVAVFALALSVATALVFGLVPALRVTRTNVGVVLRGGRFGGADTARIRRGILVLELALAMTLLTGAGLGIKGFAGLSNWDPGFDQEGLVVTWMIADFSQLESGAEMVESFELAAQVVAALPGIDAVGQTSSGPLFGGIETAEVLIAGAQPGGQLSMAQHFDIGPRYFDTLGIPIVRGRGVLSSDGAEGAAVAVVNEALVRRYWPDGDPLGAEIAVNEHVATVVGVVRDTVPFAPGDPVRPAVYWPKRQYWRGATYLIMRTALPPTEVEKLVRDRLSAEVPVVEVTTFRTLRDMAGQELVSPRFQIMLLSTFALAALLLSSVGIYSIVAYGVAQQSREIGVRLALGAHPRRIAGDVVRSGVRLAVVGGAIGVLGALALARSLEAVLHGVSSTDPLALASVAVLFVLIAAVACWLPARRAGRVDPVGALRG